MKRARQMMGFIIFFIGWFVLYKVIDNPLVFPSPQTIPTAITDLFKTYDLIGNAWFSIKLNFYGFAEATLIAVPLGYLLALNKNLKETFSGLLSTTRFLPLTAMTGLFVVWFGIETFMKAQFLAFGIFVYLLPAVIEKVEKVDKVYANTLKTLGANKKQIIWHGYVKPSLPVIWEDIRILTAISWTYIIIAELLNKTGGLGSIIYNAQRFSRPDIIFTLLLIITMIGLTQDLLFRAAGKLLFPHMHKSIKSGGIKNDNKNKDSMDVKQA